MRYCAALVLLPAVALMACGLIGCGGGRYRPGYIPPDGAVQTPIPLPEAPGPTPFHEAAYVRYSRGDYVRALRDAYRAAEAPLPDDRLPFFIGLVYDTGFNRPDLAIPEYRRFLRHRPRDRPGRNGLRGRRLRQRQRRRPGRFRPIPTLLHRPERCRLTWLRRLSLLLHRHPPPSTRR